MNWSVHGGHFINHEKWMEKRLYEILLIARMLLRAHFEDESIFQESIKEIQKVSNKIIEERLEKER